MTTILINSKTLQHSSLHRQDVCTTEVMIKLKRGKYKSKSETIFLPAITIILDSS